MTMRMASARGGGRFLFEFYRFACATAALAQRHCTCRSGGVSASTDGDTARHVERCVTVLVRAWLLPSSPAHRRSSVLCLLASVLPLARANEDY